MRPEELEASKVVLIRHGLSEFNLASLIAKAKFGIDSKENEAVNKDDSLIDPKLHEIGIIQSEAH
jgi:hypothetical protein